MKCFSDSILGLSDQFIILVLRGVQEMPAFLFTHTISPKNLVSPLTNPLNPCERGTEGHIFLGSDPSLCLPVITDWSRSDHLTSVTNEFLSTATLSHRVPVI